MRAVFGFTYPEFDAVRTAVQDFYSEKLTRLRDVTAEIAVESNGGRLPQTEERIAEGRQAFVDFLFLPGQRASFRVADIVDRTDLDATVVSAVLQTFSIGFDGDRSPSKVVFDFLRGDNPIARTPLVVDDNNGYVMTSLQIGTDSFRRIVEQGLKSHPRYWQRYDRVRMEVSEELAVSYLATALQTPPAFTGLKYYSPRPGTAPVALDAACRDPAGVAEPTEADALFIVDDVALCLEVKGRSIADPARRGDVMRLARELEQTIGSAASQARRLERLIEANSGLWLEDGTWLDLSAVREVRSVAVGLDDFGPSGTALDELRRAGVIADEKLPWVTSLHDLATISSVVDRPAEFLLYLRRRADSAVAEIYRASDELDLFMLFLDGGLFVEPDPDEMHRRYGGERPPTERDRRRYADSMRPTRVGTFTDPLDAWMYYTEGGSPFPAEKPSFISNPVIFQIVDYLAEGRKPGWFRFAADLLALSGKTQARLATGMKKLWRQTRADGRPHSLMQSYAGAWGYPAFFAAAIPTTADATAAADSLRRYMSAKKHQLRSDRALAVLFDEQGSIIDALYANDPHAPSAELDLLVDRMQLMPLGPSSRPPWDSARSRSRRPTRLQGRRRRR